MRLGIFALLPAGMFWSVTSGAQDAGDIERIANTMVRLCVAGGSTEAVSGGGAGGADLSLRSLDVKGNLKGEFKVTKSNAEGLVGGIENAMTQIAADQADKVRACLEPVRQRLLDVMLPPKPNKQGYEPPDEKGGDTASLNIGGRWRDHSGSVFLQVMQEGNTFSFSAEGPSCIGGYVQSWGRGSVTGDRFVSIYNSSLPSAGRCSGTIYANGTQVMYDCTDTICGTYSISAIKQ